MKLAGIDPYSSCSPGVARATQPPAWRCCQRDFVMSGTLASHEEIVGRDVIEHLRQLARPLEGLRVVHVNSTRLGGGVAET